MRVTRTLTLAAVRLVRAPAMGRGGVLRSLGSPSLGGAAAHRSALLGAAPCRRAASSSGATPKKRRLPPSIIVAETAVTRLTALLRAQPSAVGMRIGMTNDWGSASGFSYTLDFVAAGQVTADDEVLELQQPEAAGGAEPDAPAVTLYVARQALWVGEGGLLGATLDLDENYALVITPKDKERFQDWREGGNHGASRTT